MIPAPVGYKCPSCAKTKLGQLQDITLKQYIIGGLSGIIIGAGVGYIWYNLSVYGVLVSLLISYAVGLCVSRAISASIGNKIGVRVQLFAAIITIVSMVYNPIIFAICLLQGISFPFVCAYCVTEILAVVIAVWASIRHFRL